MLHIAQIGEVAGIGEQIKINNAIVGLFIHKKSHHVRADKSGTTGNHYCFREFIHFRSSWLKHFTNDAYQWGIVTPKVLRIFALSSTEKCGRAAAVG